ncbi:MAG: methylated-DNA--[protein]-cysteine S-methyltransferase [Planctomycetes bacterium]|nr:methylated-DNA--[protein]-cysteine S-methyltransferase [Planctomycetota bacterium]
MKKYIRYSIFKTKWGYFGLTAIENGLLRTHLPLSNRHSLEQNLLKCYPEAKFDKNLFRDLQNQIIAYFEGSYVDFDKDIDIQLDGFSDFSKKVLGVCRNIRFGQTVSYGQLAKKAGSPAAARAVGGIMAKNQTPLIIPCHRVIRSDSQLGGFSATGGTTMKGKMLQLESPGTSLFSKDFMV